MRYDKNLIGVKFIKRMGGGKIKYTCTVIDILRTFNENNEIVNVEYVYEYKFCEQIIKATCPHTTVILNLI